MVHLVGPPGSNPMGESYIKRDKFLNLYITYIIVMLLEDLSLKRFKFSPFVFKILSNNINKRLIF